MISECEQEMIDCIRNGRFFDEKRIDVSDNTVRLRKFCSIVKIILSCITNHKYMRVFINIFNY